MFSVSLLHIAILLIAALFILGPDRLPEAARWLGRTIRQVRQYADNTRDHLRSELGEDFEQFREPLEQLNTLRGLDPRRAVTNYLFDDKPADPLSRFSSNSNGDEPHTMTNGAGSVTRQEPLRPGEEPPFDADAT
jgi:sec-independent protein translocase protein TatB